MSPPHYGININENLPGGRAAIAIGALIAMGYLCIFELAIIIFTTFQRRNGLYFWSMAIAITGSFIFDIGCTLFFFAPGEWRQHVITAAICIGYSTYIPAEFLVLYSRLHLLSASRRTLRFVLALAVAECTLVTLPNIVISTVAFSTNLPSFLKANALAQRIEIIIYMVTEIVISIIYIRQTLQVWSLDSSSKAKRVLKYLICANGFLICLDTVTVVIEYTGHPQFMVALSCFIYPFKLKVEIWVLNELTILSKSSREQMQNDFGSEFIASASTAVTESSLHDANKGEEISHFS